MRCRCRSQELRPCHRDEIEDRPQKIKQLVREFNISSKLKHENLVNLLKVPNKHWKPARALVRVRAVARVAAREVARLRARTQLAPATHPTGRLLG